MKNIIHPTIAFFLKILGMVLSKVFTPKTDAGILKNEDANSYLNNLLSQTCNEGLMISKLGTYELKAFLCFNSWKEGLKRRDIKNILLKQYVLYHSKEHAAYRLCNNSGFFPNSNDLLFKYAELFKNDLEYMDVLCSYQKEEAYITPYLNLREKVNLTGFYAPFRYSNPWTKQLEGKKVLVVSPFVDSIKKQYARREYLFDNSDVLPKFSELICVRAVQSIANTPVDYVDWFAALDAMEKEMDSYDYDVALIGCGAYGFHLAAHVKRNHKIGIQLAGWLQFLFGIYGNRWTKDQPEYAKFINKYWIRPDENERPQNFKIIEDGCYW